MSLSSGIRASAQPSDPTLAAVQQERSALTSDLLISMTVEDREWQEKLETAILQYKRNMDEVFAKIDKGFTTNPFPETLDRELAIPEHREETPETQLNSMTVVENPKDQIQVTNTEDFLKKSVEQLVSLKSNVIARGSVAPPTVFVRSMGDRVETDELIGLSSQLVSSEVFSTARPRYSKKLISGIYHRARKKGIDMSGVLGYEVSAQSAKRFMGAKVVDLKRRSHRGKKVAQRRLSQACRRYVSQLLYPITDTVLHQVFDPYGTVEKIVTVSKSVDGFQALIHYQSQHSAFSAKTALHGRNIYEDCCKLDIQFSNLGAKSKIGVHKVYNRILRERRKIVDNGAVTKRSEQLSSQVKPDSSFYDRNKRVALQLEGMAFSRVDKAANPSLKDYETGYLSSESRQRIAEVHGSDAVFVSRVFDPGGAVGVYERSGVMITQAQRGEQGIVYMLWEFQERIVSDGCSVLICSDGDGMVKIRVAGTWVFTVFNSETYSDILDWSDFELEIDKNTKQGGTRMIENAVTSTLEPLNNTVLQDFCDVFGITLEDTLVKNAEGDAYGHDSEASQSWWHRYFLEILYLESPYAVRLLNNTQKHYDIKVPEIHENASIIITVVQFYNLNSENPMRVNLIHREYHSLRPPEAWFSIGYLAAGYSTEVKKSVFNFINLEDKVVSAGEY